MFFLVVLASLLPLVLSRLRYVFDNQSRLRNAETRSHIIMNSSFDPSEYQQGMSLAESLIAQQKGLGRLNLAQSEVRPLSPNLQILG